MEVILLLVRIFLFGVFALAGIGKLLDPEGAERAAREFGVPNDLAKPFAYLLPAVELLVALLLLPATTAWFGALGALLLLAVFIGGMIWQMAQGNAPDCHCFGAIHSEPVSTKSLIRNVVFALLALFAVGQGYGRPGLSLVGLDDQTTVQLFLGLAIIGLLGAVVFYLKKISEQQSQIMRRIEVLEIVMHEDGREVKREEAGNITDSLPIGAVAPDFELPGLDGRIVAFEHLLARAKPLLFFYVSPGCLPCQSLLPEIEEWRRDLGENVEFVFLSSGTSEANREKFGDGLPNVLLQEDKEIAALFHARWTPTAIFVNADGVVASHPAVGDVAIRDLVAKVKAIDFTRRTVFIANGEQVKIGQEVPEFALKDVHGREITADFLKGRKTLVTFWSTTCPHCLNMIRDLQEWDRQKGMDEPNLLVFSDGDVEEHREIGLQSPIVLDKGYRTAEKLGMFGTPSAVLINENGKIISETAVGAANIWSLIGKRK
ncbi:MAG: redoxin domain-containing protein [Acidobacteria bacterium]|nr:redoxin domain-containing protein [Acidobacteriota bacterium]